MLNKIFGRWSEFKEIERDFVGVYGDKPYTPIPNFPTEDELILAVYGGGSYDGCAFVLYQQHGKLFEVNGAHCSCYGLEEQWEPEETTWEALETRKFSGFQGDWPDDVWQSLLAQHS